MLAKVEALGLEVEILVNNAGFGGSGPVHRSDPARLASMVALNCETLVHLQASLSPAMVDRGRGAMRGYSPIVAHRGGWVDGRG